MRHRKSSPANSKPPTNGAAIDSERRLDVAYRSLGDALRLWRRAPDDEARKKALIAAVDERDDALSRAIDDEITREENARVSR